VPTSNTTVEAHIGAEERQLTREMASLDVGHGAVLCKLAEDSEIQVPLSKELACGTPVLARILRWLREGRPSTGDALSLDPR